MAVSVNKWVDIELRALRRAQDMGNGQKRGGKQNKADNRGGVPHIYVERNSINFCR